MSYLVLTLCVLIVVALASAYLARHMARGTGLPAGQLLYGDTGFPVGKVSPVIRDVAGVRQERPLRSERYGLVGRPDYLVRTADGIVPVEAKSTACPVGGRPYASHVMQLVAYCLLVEDVLGEAVPYGIIKYRDREVRVGYTPELATSLVALVGEMREAAEAAEVHRSHEDVRRCVGCSMRDVCAEPLA